MLITLLATSLHVYFCAVSELKQNSLVDEHFEALASVFDELVFEDAVVASEGQLARQRFARKRRHHDLKENTHEDVLNCTLFSLLESSHSSEDVK